MQKQEKEGKLGVNLRGGAALDQGEGQTEPQGGRGEVAHGLR